MEYANPKKQPSKLFDYAELARLYNQAELGASVKLDERAYNITLFRKSVARRGVTPNEDFKVFNSGGDTYVQRLTIRTMTEA